MKTKLVIFLGAAAVAVSAGAGLSHLLWSSIKSLQPVGNKREQ